MEFEMARTTPARQRVEKEAAADLRSDVEAYVSRSIKLFEPSTIQSRFSGQDGGIHQALLVFSSISCSDRQHLATLKDSICYFPILTVGIGVIPHDFVRGHLSKPLHRSQSYQRSVVFLSTISAAANDTCRKVRPALRPRRSCIFRSYVHMHHRTRCVSSPTARF